MNAGLWLPSLSSINLLKKPVLWALTHSFTCFYPWWSFSKIWTLHREIPVTLETDSRFLLFHETMIFFPLWWSRLTPQEILLPESFHLCPGLKANDPWSPWALHKSQSNLLRDACGKHLQLKSKRYSEKFMLYSWGGTEAKWPWPVASLVSHTQAQRTVSMGTQASAYMGHGACNTESVPGNALCSALPKTWPIRNQILLGTLMMSISLSSSQFSKCFYYRQH